MGIVVLGPKFQKGSDVRFTHRPMVRFFLAAVVLVAHGHGWWFGNNSKPTPEFSER